MLGKFFTRKQLDLDATQEEQQELHFDESEVESKKAEAENMNEEDIHKHEEYYTNEGLWEKIKKYSKKAGSNVVYVVLILYFTLQKPEVPLRVKATIAGALGYFILPLDLLPDVALGAGYVDDFSILMAALFQVVMYIDDDVKNQAKEKLQDLFGKEIDTAGIDEKLK